MKQSTLWKLLLFVIFILVCVKVSNNLTSGALKLSTIEESEFGWYYNQNYPNATRPPLSQEFKEFYLKWKRDIQIPFTTSKQGKYLVYNSWYSAMFVFVYYLVRNGIGIGNLYSGAFSCYI